MRALFVAAVLMLGLTVPAAASEPPVCTASWYGNPDATTPVHTASGEVLDPAAMTAAHATLPFDTKVKVTNRRTGLSVEVRINDRFAAQGDRCVNLTRGAFEKIAPLSMGVAPVDVSPS
ncbi:septal ring lytic transglycosylase RlpA family protein [Allokutzneria albata]|uniref:Rare lipoprotein A n=1 Tax=Allokutzneria albata TaxID=211114 RepID=A0A1H0D5A8_ALLAB|nr:septal ring lytic transglycosylase RlpA family protein [Allokutzneria albata]SDN65360.1 rare lipoprotein A [Allokutzneria albata]